MYKKVPYILYCCISLVVVFQHTSIIFRAKTVSLILLFNADGDEEISLVEMVFSQRSPSQDMILTLMMMFRNTSKSRTWSSISFRYCVRFNYHNNVPTMTPYQPRPNDTDLTPLSC